MKKSLHGRAAVGEVSADELKALAKRIEEGEGDPYDWLFVIGKSCATQYRPLVESFLAHPSDPMLSRLALQILCQYWSLGQEYQHQVVQFCKGVEWDVDEDVRLMAISCASELLKATANQELLQVLYEIYVDDEEDDLTKDAAMGAMASAVGESTTRLRLPEDERTRILERVASQVAGIRPVEKEGGITPKSRILNV